VWLLWLLAAGWLALFATRVHVYFVVPDEVRYVRQAVAWADGRPVVPGSESWVGWSQVLPLLMAPLWGAFDSFDAYRLTHVLTALAFASVVFPVYLLGRDVLGARRWALAGAGLSVVVPWSVMTGVVMLENAAYPIAAWAVLAVHRAVARPSPRRDRAALGVLLLAFLTRRELLALWPALPVGLVVQERRLRGLRLGAVVGRHRLVTAVLLAGVVLGALVPEAIHGRAAGAAPEGSYASLAYAREVLAYVAVGIGMVPLALSGAWVAATLSRPLDPVRHAYAVVLLTVTATLTVVVGGGSLTFTKSLEGVNDRYLCYLAPLLMVGMLACVLERRLPLCALAGGGAFAAWVAWTGQLKLAGPTFITPTATWHPVLNRWAEALGEALGTTVTSGRMWAGVTLLAVAALAAARRVVPTGALAAALVAVVGGYGFAQATYTRARLLDIQPGARYGAGRDWVDRRLPHGERAALLLSGLGVDGQTAAATWWDLSFWNRRVVANRHAGDEGPRWSGQAVSHALGMPTADGHVSGLERYRYLVRAVADRRHGFVGESAFGAPHNNIQIWWLPAPTRLSWWFLGEQETGVVPAGRTVAVRVFGDGRPGHRTVELALGTPLDATRPARFALTAGGRALARGPLPVGEVVRPRIVVTLPARGHADVTLRAGAAAAQFYGAALR
jgi:hypothetical protein